MFSTYRLDEFGSILRTLRLNCRLTQKNVYESTGINQDTLRRIENGSVIPKYETLEILSQVYKADLLLYLISCRADKSINDFYSDLDKIILSNEVKISDSIINELNEISSSKLVNQNDFVLLRNFVEATVIYHKYHSESYQEVINNLIKCLNLSNNQYSYNDFENYQYTTLEIRVLLLIGLFKVRNDKIEESNKILLFCLNYIEKYERNCIEFLQLKTKLILNISYNYHRLSQNLDALKYADIGISHVLSFNSLYCLPHLFARKGVAEFLLKYEDYLSSLEYSIQLFKISGDIKSAENYKRILKNKYNISF